MLDIKHTICPSCSVGCGLNLISKEGKLVGTYPYKRHPINEGKNCKNGRNCIEQYKTLIKTPSMVHNKELVDSDLSTVIDTIMKKINEVNSEEITILCSGDNTNEEIELIKKFAENYECKIGFYGHNFIKFNEELPSYENIANANTILFIGDILKENPLIGRRIIQSKENGGKLINVDTVDSSVSSLNSEEFITTDTLEDFLNNIPNDIKSELDENSVILINKLENPKEFENLLSLSKETNAKLLPVLPECNTKGTMEYLNPMTSAEITELISNSKILITLNTNPLEYIDSGELQKIKFIINFSNFKDEFTKISDLVIPGKSWAEKSGSFTNSAGTKQEFEVSVINPENENETETEVFKILGEKLGIDL